MLSIACRTLKREFRLEPPDETTAAALRFVAATPEIAGVELEPAQISIVRRGQFLAATMPDGEVVEGSPGHLVGALHRIVLTDLVASQPGAPLVHGATVIIGGRRLLMVGHKGCGKSTLALHLALAGHEVEGDEHLVLREQDVIARPRTLRIKQGTLTLVAGVAAAVMNAPSLVNWDGSVIRAIRPDIGGRPWVIRPGRLDGLIFLTANHGGRSAARRIRTEDAFGRLMREVMLPTVGIAAAAARIRGIATQVPSHELFLGHLATAEWHLQHIAAGLTTI